MSDYYQRMYEKVTLLEEENARLRRLDDAACAEIGRLGAENDRLQCAENAHYREEVVNVLRAAMRWFFAEDDKEIRRAENALHKTVGALRCNGDLSFLQSEWPTVPHTANAS